MEENYYDILQVNKNASKEIIEKAYKTLVKKYHPDLQKENNKIEYEEKIKKINKAYEVLSDAEKRKNYDLILKKNEVSITDYNNLYQENLKLKNNLNILKQKLIDLNNNSIHNNSNYNKNPYTHENLSYQNNYIKNSRNIIYKYKPILKNLISLFITFLIIVFTIFILWQIPFVRNYFIQLYEKNETLKFFINIILNIFK
ncbi:MAG: J domain-containing protein [Clostridia bacterium]|nr:J domain-containing protein [Clostridia bacterium]